MRQTITLVAVSTRDSFGKPTYSAQTTAPARVQPHRKLIRDPRGNEAPASHVIYTQATITIDSRIWIPGDDTSNFGNARRPIDIDTVMDFNGNVAMYRVYV